MARVLQSLELFAPSLGGSSAQPTVGRRQASSQLWIAVCSAEPRVRMSLRRRFGCARRSRRGRARSTARRRREPLRQPRPASLRERSSNTAMALAASLQVFERAPSLERKSLESLAAWAQMLTSMVSVEAPESLLLEVAGSLKLFGSLDAIKAKLRGELARRYRDFRFCAAPTATAALWLARAASTDVLQWRQLAGSLAALPLAVTRWPPEVQALLQDLGLRTVGDCARLPRDGFARRVGRSYLLELDRAFGRSVDLRAEFKAPQAWSSIAELGEESVDSAIFIEAVEQLLDELCAELKKRQAQIGEPRARLRASASAAHRRKLRFARTDFRSRSIAASHRGSVGAQRAAGSGRGFADERAVCSGLSSARKPICSRSNHTMSARKRCSSVCKGDSAHRQCMACAPFPSTAPKKLGRNRWRRGHGCPR